MSAASAAHRDTSESMPRQAIMQTTQRLLETARMRRIAVAVAAVLVVGLVAAAPASGGKPRGGIRWHGCGRQVPPRLQCGELAVPLDYRHPRGAKIRLGLTGSALRTASAGSGA
jgi:hypothetical protein